MEQVNLLDGNYQKIQVCGHSMALIKIKDCHVFITLNKQVNRQKNILKQGFSTGKCHASLAIIHGVKILYIPFL